MGNTSRTGFTLVELLIVIAVIAILAAIGVVAYQKVVEKTYTSSLKNDIAAMDRAQKRYMALTGGTPIETSESGDLNDTLAFASNEGNTIIVQMKDAQNYCIYGYNPKSSYRTAGTAFYKSTSSSACAPLIETDAISINSVYSTVAIIGQRLEAFRAERGAYPLIAELIDIGLVIKPNANNANQQQLYCRNSIKAIYLQKDKDNNIVFAYDTDTKIVSEPADLAKLSLNNVCPNFSISPGQDGYESTGVKNPDI